MKVKDAVRMKRAVRQFKAEPLKPDVINSILNAGRRSQSSKNTQPWYFIAIQDKMILEELSKYGKFAGHLGGAALGVAIATPDPLQKFSIMFDAGQAAAYMQLAAWELGVGSCLATIYEPEKAGLLLEVPQQLHVNMALSFGYPAQDDIMSTPPVKGGRKMFDEIVRWERW